MTLAADTMPPLPLRDVGAVGSHSAVSDSDAIQVRTRRRRVHDPLTMDRRTTASATNILGRTHRLGGERREASVVAAHDVRPKWGYAWHVGTWSCHGNRGPFGLPAPPMNSATGTLNGDGESRFPSRRCQCGRGRWKSSRAFTKHPPRTMPACRVVLLHQLRVQDEDESESADTAGMAMRYGLKDDDPNQLSSLLGTELFAPRSHSSVGGPRPSDGLESSEATADPNERSSPYSTELPTARWPTSTRAWPTRRA